MPEDVGFWEREDVNESMKLGMVEKCWARQCPSPDAPALRFRLESKVTVPAGRNARRRERGVYSLPALDEKQA